MMAGMGQMMGGGGFGMLFGLISWVVAVILFVALIVWIIRQLQSRWVQRVVEEVARS
jgi:uncharacterized membrane protein